MRLPGFLIPISIYTIYLITIVGDDGREKVVAIKKQKILCGAVG